MANHFDLILKRRSLAGSLIGGIHETQEMLDFCAGSGIVSDIETIRKGGRLRSHAPWCHPQHS